MRRRGKAAAWLGWVAAGLAGCTTTVRSGLDETEANHVLVALDVASIASSKTFDGAAGAGGRYRVEVATEDATRALRVLATALPEPPQPGFAELYAASSLVPTLGEERARWSAALAGELADSLRAIAGVHDARVHVALPAREGGVVEDDAPTARASVLITRRAGTPPIDEDAVRTLVSGAIEDLPAERVSVVQAIAAAQAAPDAQVVSIGPIRVLAGSAPVLKAVLGAALALDALLALALCLIVTRRRG